MTEEGDVLRRVAESDGPIYPEHEKLREVAPLSQAVYDFVEWLGTKGIHLMRWNDDFDNWIPAPNMRDLLADHFEIDQEKIELEKRAMLGFMRAANAPKDEPCP